VDGIAPQSLGIGEEGDEYEREAESFAGLIERGKSVQKSSFPVPRSRVQRLGFGHQILRFFGIESGSFSDDDLTEYLDRVDRNKKCDCGFLDFLSDDKARQIANQAGVGGYKLNQAYKSLSSIDLKRILIQEMLSGPTTGSDARAIIKILQDSDGDQILEILNPAHGLSMQDLDSSISGNNHDLLVQVLEKKLPDLGKGHFKRSDKPGEKSGACTADRAVKIHQAQKRAEAAVSRTIELIDKYLQKPKEYQQVDRNLQCYFTGADAKKAAAIREDFAGINKILAKIQYVCPAEPFKEFKVTDSNGKTTVFTCEDETQALAMVQGGVNTSPTVLFCPDYFGLPPISQASIIVHEAAHHLRLSIKDVAYGPKCQSLSFESATKNADSYAYFAMALEKDGLHFDFDDCPKEWKEKIVAATQTAQLWVNTAVSKVDSVIANPKSPDPAVAKQLQHHFKIEATSSNDLLQVRRGLVKIQSAFGRQIPFTCELGDTSPGDEDVIGRVIGFPLIGASLSNIHLYRPWFERLDDEHRAVTIVHEMAHKYAGKGEEAYYEHQFNTYRALNTSDLLDNADSFAQFTRYVQ
jgi:Lysine-specific metallo-endopeptidase